MNKNCFPQNTGNPPMSSFGPITDPCAVLPNLRSALYTLMSGQARAQIRFGEHWTTFHGGNVAQLRAEIRKLEAMCGVNADRGRAVRVGPYIPSNGAGIGIIGAFTNPRGWGRY